MGPVTIIVIEAVNGIFAVIGLIAEAAAGALQPATILPVVPLGGARLLRPPADTDRTDKQSRAAVGGAASAAGRVGRADPVLAGVDERAFNDIDSLLRPVYGHAKQGASPGHTKIAEKTVILVVQVSARW